MTMAEVLNDYPLSSPQRGVWFDQIRHAYMPLYNIGGYVRIDGPVDPSLFEKAVNRVIQETDALRTVLHEGTTLPVQVFQKAVDIKLDFYDFSAEAEPHQHTLQWMKSEFATPFHLYEQVLFKFALIKVSEECYYWLKKYHHLIIDGWGCSLIVQRVAKQYNALVAGDTSEEPARYFYPDFVQSDQKYLESESYQRHERYWQQKYRELPEPLIPYRYAGQFKGLVPSHRQALTLKWDFYQRLMAFAKANKASTFHAILGVLYCYFIRTGDREDLVIGLPVLNRNSATFKRTVGLFTGVIPARFDFGTELNFVKLIQAINAELRQDYRHQRFPLGDINKLAELHKVGRGQLFDITLSYQKHNYQTTFAGNPAKFLTLANGFEQNALAIAVEEYQENQDVRLTFDYNLAAFDDAEIKRIIARFEFMLGEVQERPAVSIRELNLMPDLERHQVLVEFNDTAAPYPFDKTIVDLFEQQVEKTPHNVAVVFEDQQLTYQALNVRANQLAHHLQTLGVKPEVLVGICIERSLEMMVGLLGILKAGGAYVPLDPCYPQERLAFMLEDTQVPVLLALKKLIDELPINGAKVVCIDADWQELIARESDENLAHEAMADNLAYIMYTSGSTGRPKGVSVIHRSIIRLVIAPNYVDLTANEVFLQLAPLSFDASTLEIWGCLLHGARLVVMPAHTPSLEELGQAIQRYQVTTLWLTAGLFHLMVEERLEDLRPVRQLLAGGEALSVPHVQKALRALETNRLINGYGPTENTTFTCCFPMTVSTSIEHTVPIGRPITNTQVYILDRYQNPTPIGIPGELYTGGAGLAQGYFNRPELTAEKFISNPFSSDLEARLYKTGDLVRYLPDGNIEYLGRFDNQIKIRGFRIELGEIEAVLAQHPHVQETAVITHEEASANKRLVAYFVSDITPAPTFSDLRDFLTEKLPDYMLPSFFVELEILPLTPNGKVDRRALSQLSVNNSQLSKDTFVAPRTPEEELLASIWAEILGIERVGIHDKFFELGGHSLLAIQVMSRIRDTFSVELPLRHLFKSPTVAGLAVCIEAMLREKPAANKESVISLPKLVAAPNQRYLPFPLTDIQQAYWIGRSGTFELGNIATHVYIELDCQDLNLERLNDAWQILIERHEMLRMVVLPTGQQQILESVPPYQIKLMDLRGPTPDVITTQLLSIRQQMSHQILPADQWPLFEIRATRLNEQQTRLHLSFDALMADAWSLHILTNEWLQLYQTPQRILTVLTLSFRDYVFTEQAWQETEGYQRSRDYWFNRLDSLPPAPELPLAMNPATLTQPWFKSRSAQLDQGSWQQLKQRATDAGLTPSGVLLAAFADILTVWSRQPRFTINLTQFNRLPVHPQVNDVMGDFTSLLLVEVDNSASDTFMDRALRVQQQLWQDLDHHSFSGVRVLRELARRQGGAQKSIMPVVFTSVLTVDAVDVLTQFGELVYSITQTPQVWLDHQVMEQQGALLLRWDAVEELFPAGLLDDMFEAYCSFLRQLARSESAWQATTKQSLIPPAQQLQRQAINATETRMSNELLHTLFTAQLQARGPAWAVISPQRCLTYLELSQLANQVGHQLRQLGASPNTLIAIVLEKGWQQVVAVLGVLMSGAAYLPIDPELPKERQWYLLEQGEVKLVLTQLGLNQQLAWPEGIQRLCLDDDNLFKGDTNTGPLELIQKPTDLAYVIFTSGSTGQPKGVAIDHRGAVNTLKDINQRFGVGPEDRVLALSALSFDLSVYDIFGLLAAGGTLVMPEADAAKDPAHWLDLITQHRITVWNTVPALMQMLVDYMGVRPPTAPKSLRLALMSGDWIPLNLPERMKALWSPAQIISLGGATEASIWSIYYPIETVDPSWKSIPYGKPLQNHTFQVFNELLEPCPIWVPGQLYIGGVGLAQGYWRDIDKTQASFIIHPHTQERLYKTGDLGRYLPDGNIEFLGRDDFQVKIRGYRIELGEIETALQQHSAVKDAAVIAVGESRENKQLVAYVIPDQDNTLLFEVKNAKDVDADILWYKLLQAGVEQARQLPSETKLHTLSAFWQTLERLSLFSICHTLRKLGIFVQSQEKHSVGALLRCYQIKPNYQKLLGQWLTILEEEDLLQRTGEDTFVNAQPLPIVSLDNLWQEIRQYAVQGGWNETLLDYFQVSVENHIPLLKGDVDPLELLFPDGNWHIAESLYQSNPLVDYHNNIACQILRSIAKKWSSEKKIRILEVGAGIGSTTASLLPVLPPQLTVYTYTDLSTFFLTKAKEKFQDYPFVQYHFFDIDQEPVCQGYELHTFDVIVAANVLHDARHIGTSLQYLRSLLAPSGLLLIIEGTQNRYWQMISVRFIEGLSHYEDERVHTNQPLLSVEEWHRALSTAGFKTFVAFPESDSTTAFSSQHVMVAQAPSSIKQFKPAELLDYMQQKLPEYMVPSVYIPLETLPLTPNGKVDRNALPSFNTTKPKLESTFVAPRTKTEKRLVTIFSAVLGIEQVGIEDNFFELGGDSLLATQVISQVRDSFQIELPLRNLFETPTVVDLAECIDAFIKAAQDMQSAQSNQLDLNDDYLEEVL